MGKLFLIGEAVGAGSAGMSGIVETLTNTITSAGLFGTVKEIFPFICIMIGFSFGYRVLRRVIKGASQGKAKC